MKLILLPGLDGTGEFFKPFLDQYGYADAQVIALPQSGPQDYATLTDYVLQRLPVNEDYVLLAESFSGLIGANLALRNLPHLKGIVFVVTFLSPPASWITALTILLPLKAVLHTSFSLRILRYLLAGPEASEETVDWVRSVIATVPPAIIRARIRAIGYMRRQNKSTTLPALYLCATQDRLVTAGKFAEFKRCFESIKLVEIPGPHMILVARPDDCARIIRQMFSGL